MLFSNSHPLSLAFSLFTRLEGQLLHLAEASTFNEQQRRYYFILFHLLISLRCQTLYHLILYGQCMAFFFSFVFVTSIQ